jgi:hypothetical protein
MMIALISIGDSEGKGYWSTVSGQLLLTDGC